MNEQKKSKSIRYLRVGVIVAAMLAVLTATAFAAYEMNWFGFRQLFGDNAEVIQDYVVTADPDNNPGITAQERSYTQREQSLMESGLVSAPEQAERSETGVQATTDDYIYTLEEMTVNEDTFLAILKAEARTDEAKSRMEQTMDKEVEPFFGVFALNNSVEDRASEVKNGGLGCDLLQLEDGVGYYLIRNSGGQFAVGDPILFTDMWSNVDLFQVTIEELMDIQVEIATAGEHFDTISITPISMELGNYDGEMEIKTCSMTLTDGTVITLPGIDNGFAYSAYGTYGALSVAGSISPETGYGVFTWTFSQVIEPEMVEKVTINGIDYFTS